MPFHHATASPAEVNTPQQLISRACAWSHIPLLWGKIVCQDIIEATGKSFSVASRSASHVQAFVLQLLFLQPFWFSYISLLSQDPQLDSLSHSTLHRGQVVQI